MSLLGLAPSKGGRKSIFASSVADRNDAQVTTQQSVTTRRRDDVLNCDGKDRHWIQERANSLQEAAASRSTGLGNKGDGTWYKMAEMTNG
jgi:hypothetical protein